MKILDISYIHNPLFRDEKSGIAFRERHLGYLRHLAERHEVWLVEPGPAALEFWADGIRHHVLAKKPSAFWLPVALHRFLKKEQFDLALVHGLRSPLQILALRWQFGRRVRIACMHHAEQPSAGAKGFLQRLADRLAVDRYFFASAENAEAWLRRGIIARPEKVREVMEISSRFRPLPSADCRARLGLPAGERILLWVGRLHPIKDPLTVLDGFAKFLEKNAARLYLVFQTEELLPALQARLAADPKLRRQTVLVGKIPNPELETWFSAADFFVLGSRYEGSGTALAEAMACGCAPVVSDIAAFRSITGQGGAGFLFRPGDPDDFAVALERACLRADAGFRATVRRHFERHLSWEAIAGNLEAESV